MHLVFLVLKKLYSVIAALLAFFVLGFVSLNIIATAQSLDMFSVPLWQMLGAGLLGLIGFIVLLWVAFPKQKPLLSANLSLALVSGNGLMLEDVGDASSLTICAIAWGLLSLAALAVHWAANKLSAVGKAKTSCAVGGAGSLVFIAISVALLAIMFL